MKKIDIKDIKKSVSEGQIRVHVNTYGFVQLIDTETGEMVVIGRAGED